MIFASGLPGKRVDAQRAGIMPVILLFFISVMDQPINSSNSLGVMVAVPSLPTTSPAAKFASSAAS